MLPIGPLMMEHRLIERMIKILRNELNNAQNLNKINPIFIDNAVDFIRTYADKTHHGKEEDILFRELKKKEISPEHEKIMNELIEEHKFGRKITGELFESKNNYVSGQKDAIDVIEDKINTLINFYPKHIEKEDKHFFIPIMNYFTENEKEEMLKEGREFDRRMIHKKYQNIVSILENERNIKIDKQEVNWIKYI